MTVDNLLVILLRSIQKSTPGKKKIYDPNFSKVKFVCSSILILSNRNHYFYSIESIHDKSLFKSYFSPSQKRMGYRLDYIFKSKIFTAYVTYREMILQ